MIDFATQALPVVGLEIHVELATRTKMFCRCDNRFGDPPNTHTCPVCIGMPGALPVMNRRAVQFAATVGLALNCTLPDFTKWDRKSYYYPDLPKNYQISQYDLPLSVEGFLDVPLADDTIKRVGIIRAHLEEDAGKNIHDYPAHTGVDLNRAGVPLLEIVSEPDMNSAEEAVAYAKAMQRLVRWLAASHANMQMGHMRFEPNINLHITRGGATFKTPIVEVKNLNSFRSLEGAVAYEIERQYAQWQSDPSYTLEKLGKQNRGWDDVKLVTLFQREKEEAHDYRYLPDPDLAPVIVEDAWRDSLIAAIGELPLDRRARYMEQYKLSFKEADALTQDAPSGNLLDEAVQMGANPKRVTNFLLGRISAAANERGCSLAEVGVTGKDLCDLATLVDQGKVNPTGADKILAVVVNPEDWQALGVQDLRPSGDQRGPSMELGRIGGTARALNVLAVSDAGVVEAWVDAAIAANPGPAEQVRTGAKKAAQAFGFLVGAAMKASGGKAPPALVKELLERKLRGEKKNE